MREVLFIYKCLLCILSVYSVYLFGFSLDVVNRDSSEIRLLGQAKCIKVGTVCTLKWS